MDLTIEENLVAPTQQIALCLFRIAQEALQNVGRHARASRAEVSLQSLDSGFQIYVRDDGVGFDPKHHRDRPSLGLASMQQRIYLLGGELDIESSPGHGTIVLASGCQQGRSVMRRARVLLADDHRMVTEGLKNLLADRILIWWVP